MLGFPGVASIAWEVICENGGWRGKRGGISSRATQLLCAGGAGKAPWLKHSQTYAAGHDPNLVTLMSWYSGFAS